MVGRRRAAALQLQYANDRFQSHNLSLELRSTIIFRLFPLNRVEVVSGSQKAGILLMMPHRVTAAFLRA